MILILLDEKRNMKIKKKKQIRNMRKKIRKTEERINRKPGRIIVMTSRNY